MTTPLEHDADYDLRCQTCNGRGTRPPHNGDEDACRSCMGSGRVLCAECVRPTRAAEGLAHDGVPLCDGHLDTYYSPLEVEHDIERLTVDDLRTIDQIFMDLAADRRRLVDRLERIKISEQARRIALANNQEAADRYARIAYRARREIEILEWEV